MWGDQIRWRLAALVVKEFTQDRTKEVEVYHIYHKGEAYTTKDSKAEKSRDCLPRGSGGGLQLKREGEEVWECMELSFFDTCVWV